VTPEGSRPQRLRNLTRDAMAKHGRLTLAALAGMLNLKNLRVDVLLVSPRRIRKYNKKFRGLDQPTDVLSFPDPGEPLGDLLICPSIVRQNARRYGNSAPSEFDFVLLHGLLHLLGYDHKRRAERQRMEKRERIILKKLGYQELSR
jgi:probable rRNA maturation factor